MVDCGKNDDSIILKGQIIQLAVSKNRPILVFSIGTWIEVDGYLLPGVWVQHWIHMSPLCVGKYEGKLPYMVAYPFQDR